MGSKSKIAKDIIPIITEYRNGPEQWYVEPFCGRCNVIDKIGGNRIAADSNKYLIAMWKMLIEDGFVPTKITRDEYMRVRANRNTLSPGYVGWVGFNCSYSGKWFGGYAGDTETRIGTVRDYQTEAIRNTLKQIRTMFSVKFVHSKYNELEIPEGAIVYCDPPYQSTTGYHQGMDHTSFWNWVRKTSESHLVYISEYQAPDDFLCVWEKEVSSSLSANGVVGANKKSVERLFVLK